MEVPSASVWILLVRLKLESRFLRLFAWNIEVNTTRMDGICRDRKVILKTEFIHLVRGQEIEFYAPANSRIWHTY